MEITNRQILITGASRGMGRAFAMMCAEYKAYLHIVLRKEDTELVEELKRKGAKEVKFYLADLGTRSGVQSVLDSLQEANIDILFNNAGVLIGGVLEEQSADDIYNMLQLNVNSLIHLTQGVLPGMISRKRGKIINHSSVAAYLNFPSLSTYCASKAAVAAFTHSLRLELKGTGVTTLLLVTPGIKTKLYDDLEKSVEKHFEIPGEPLAPNQYVEMIREAILQDLKILEPSGLPGWGLKISKYMKPLFDFEVSRRFKRD